MFTENQSIYVVNASNPFISYFHYHFLTLIKSHMHFQIAASTPNLTSVFINSSFYTISNVFLKSSKTTKYIYKYF